MPLDSRVAFVGHAKTAHKIHPKKWFLTACGRLWSYRSKDKGFADECLKCPRTTK